MSQAKPLGNKTVARDQKELTNFHLQSLSMPIAAIETLAELISHSNSSTTTELLSLLHVASSQLAAASFNPISLSSGTSLFVSRATLPVSQTTRTVTHMY